MRVLLQSRAETFRRQGGEALQILRLWEALVRSGVEAELSPEINPPLDRVDVVHLFGITQPAETLAQARNAARCGVPIVLTPVYQDLNEYHHRGKGAVPLEPLRDWARLCAQAAAGEWPGAASWRAHWQALPLTADEQRREILSRAAGLLANSALELEALQRLLPANTNAPQTRGVMRLGVSEIFADAHPGMFRACWKAQLNGFIDRRELIVCAGFLSRLKNQLALVEALTGTGRILVLAGAEVPTHRGYARRLRSAAQHAGSSVLMTGSLSQEELASLFSAAKVVVLPSWFETCGMACLEGAAAGANVVITDRGYAREYFGDAAWYCDPGSVESIRKAVQEAFAAPRQLDFTKRIQRELTWEAAACMARETYAQVSRRGVR